MKRVVVVIVALALVSTAGASTAGTEIELYAPFSADTIASGIQVGHVARGSCWTTSIADSRTDAFRCTVGNYIHDPCFASSPGGPTVYVLCPMYTPAAKVLRINLTKALPSHAGGSDPMHYPPWAIQTATGKWCTAITGATSMVAGMRVSYGCIGGGVLLGSPHRASANWRMFYATSYDAGASRLVPLRSVWW